ncbi:unnamed protein product [Sphenostylis stenocarpa]|uniref:Uncharacterized protein n=1 Tax=Sphenostylis stenocarpa TaxID=92480 RepID=A0AA86T3J9_9FABA|nr:unnamed protein product [Sphenostylis stenocarpa]
MHDKKVLSTFLDQEKKVITLSGGFQQRPAGTKAITTVSRICHPLPKASPVESPSIAVIPSLSWNRRLVVFFGALRGK